MPGFTQSAFPAPLAGVRVVEISDGKTGMCGRILADLGAEVVLVEPPGGAVSRRVQPMHGADSLYFMTHDANKQSVVLDARTPGGQVHLHALAGAADLLIDCGPHGRPQELDFSLEAIRLQHPGLVVLSLTDFGLQGPYRDYRGGNAVQLALGGVLSRSGLPGREPLLPPGNFAYECAAVQAAMCALLALWQRRKTGAGDLLDFSVLDATLQIMDPALGVTGSAAAGKSALDGTSRGRPPAHPLYPIFRCRDGYVRICVLNPRQWEGMSEWLGADHAYTDPAFGSITRRMAAAAGINALIAQLFERAPAAELVAEGQRRGVPIAAVAEPGDVLSDPHFVARGVFTALRMEDGSEGRVPAGYLEIDGRRAGMRASAPVQGECRYAWAATVANALVEARHAGTPPSGRRPSPPLTGLRVLDLGVIVAGAETGRMFADHGAEVIKVENKAFPDGGRQSTTGERMSVSMAQGHRGKQSVGINLKSAKGRDLFKQLVARSDIILSNFKPGTLEKLGLGYDVLREVNPRIIMADSSALGNTGPQSRSLGYGPLVRAASGLTRLWCYPEVDSSFSDGATIYPDHFAARVATVGVLAKLFERETTGIGGTVSVSQAECFLNANAEHFLRESLQPGSCRARGNHSEWHAPFGVFPCAGDDEWCVVAIEDDAAWRRFLCVSGQERWLDEPGLAGAEGRLAQRERVNDMVAGWTRQHSPRQVMETLQAAGISAGLMRRICDLEEDPHLQARQFFARLDQPGIATTLLTESGPVLAWSIPPVELRPAPYQAEHTRAIAARLLGLSEEEIARLVEAGDLEDMTPL